MRDVIRRIRQLSITSFHRHASRPTLVQRTGLRFTLPPSRNLATLAGDSKQANPGIQLRPYQEESIQSVLDYLSNGEQRLGISLATGGGKTVIFSHLIDRVPPPSPDATQTLILAHRRELVEQAARHCRNLYPNKTVDIEMGMQHASGLADITVASVQSIMSGDRIMRYNPSRFKLLLVDEAHHIVAPSYLDVLRHFKLLAEDKEQQGNTALVGVSATFSRADGLKLGTAVDHIVYHKDYVDMIEEKWLATVRFTTVHSGADLSKVQTSGGDFQTASLSKAVNTIAANDVTVRSWLTTAKARKSTLVFCVDLKHVANLTAAFRAHGINARFVTSETRSATRAETLASFKAGEFPVLLNCGIFTEGTDIPNIDCVLLARPTKSRNLLIQMIGRGLRNAPGKEDCHVIDMVASLDRGLVTTPTLFGLDPQVLIKDVNANEMKSMKDRRESERLREQVANDASASGGNEATAYEGNITFTHYDDVNALLEHTSGEQHIRKISNLAWVQVDFNRYILSNNTGTFLTIKVEERDFLVTCTQKIQNQSEEQSKKRTAPYMRPFVIATNSTFEDAVHSADTYAKKKFVVPMILANAPWRRVAATPEQIKFLNRFRGEDKQLHGGSITKGRAADWITKIKHGARGRLKRINTDRAKAERQHEKTKRCEEQQRREQIKVGPLSRTTLS